MRRISPGSRVRTRQRRETVPTGERPMEAVRPGLALGAFSKNRKPWSPPKQVLAPEKSAALRDRLVGELSGLASAEEATAWAQRALGAKNTLRDVDAAIVEAAFASRMAELERTAKAPCRRLQRPARVPRKPPYRRAVRSSWRPYAPPRRWARPRKHHSLRTDAGARRGRAEHTPPSPPQTCAPPQPSGSSQPEAPPVNNAVAWHVDKSALPLSEPRRYRDRAHLKFVASQPCLRCDRQPSEPHHLRIVQPRALGRKVSDEYVVPLCRTHRWGWGAFDVSSKQPHARYINTTEIDASRGTYPFGRRQRTVFFVSSWGANPTRSAQRE